MGCGVSSSIEAVPKNHKTVKKWEVPKIWYHILLDSGSDGDMMFITIDNLKNVPYNKKGRTRYMENLNSKLILWIDTLAKFDTILDFAEKSIQINLQEIAIRSKSNMGQAATWFRSKNSSNI